MAGLSESDRRTPLGSVNQDEVDAFWQRFQPAAGRAGRVGLAPEAWPFGDSVELADDLIALVLTGIKRATAGAVADYEHQNEPLPTAGQLEIATDGLMRPRAVLELTEVRVGPLSSVDAAFAYDEGEGDRSLAYWVEAHKGFFQRYLPTIGVAFSPDMPTVFQRFKVVYQEA